MYLGLLRRSGREIGARRRVYLGDVCFKMSPFNKFDVVFINDQVIRWRGISGSVSLLAFYEEADSVEPIVTCELKAEMSRGDTLEIPRGWLKFPMELRKTNAKVT